MFSSILSLAITGISITEEDKFQSTTDQYILSKQVLTPVAKDQQKDSLLSVLDDKNKIIANLKKQLQNQKMQLTYYIQKDMNKGKITQLSQSCMPQASEDSLPLNLAINKFCKQSGIKTKLLLLHERMSQLEYKIGNALKDQEFILRKIVNKLCEIVKAHQPKSRDFKEHFKSFVSDPAGVSLFDKLLTATIALGRKLDSFKICCDRVLIIEEERNAIIEQVYSIPIEERINRTCLAEVQIENLHLEHQLKRIFEQQSADKHRIQELSLIEKILNNLQWELNSTYLKNEESCISKLLNKINSEARVLLEMTKEQKRKFECELSKTNSPEPNRVLLFINIAGGNNLLTEDNYDRWGIKTKEEIKFFEMVRTEVDLIKSKLKKEVQKEVEESKIEVAALREKLTQAMIDQTSARNVNESLKEELDELKKEQRTAMMRLKTERDAYKSQVDDLQAIREAYAQLVEKQPNVSHVERKLWQEVDLKEQKLKELEKIVASQSEELSYMKSKLSEQKEQIIFLNRYINLTKSNSPKLVPTECVDNHSAKVLSSLDSSRSNIRCYNKTRIVEDQKFKSNKPSILRCKMTSRSCSPIQIPTLEVSRPTKNLPRFSCPDILPLSEQNTVKSTSFASQVNINEQTSSILTVEIKYESSEISNTANLFALEETELFRDASQESVVEN